MAQKNKWWSGEYNLKNPSKYTGGKKPEYRSSWELKLMEYFDSHPNVVAWSYESIPIYYWHPFKRKTAKYIPDFFVQYVDKNGNSIAEIIEVKPLKQTIDERVRNSSQDRYAQIINGFKWKAAHQFCRSKGIRFRVMTENNLFMTKAG